MNASRMSLNDLCQLENRGLGGIEDVDLSNLILKCKILLSGTSGKLTNGEKKTLNQVIKSCEAQLEVLKQKRLER